MNAKELRDEAEKMRARAESARNDASQAEVSLQAQRERGNDSNAMLEASHKGELVGAADEYDQKADAMETEAHQKDQQADAIEQQQNQLKAETDRRLAEMEKQKEDLRGGRIGLF